MDVVAGIFNKLIVAAPFLLVTSLGFKAREQKPTFSYVAYSPVENRNVSAYIPVVRDTKAAFEGKDFVEARIARKLANEWIQGAASGVLKTLPQISIDDSSRDGVKGEILRNAQAVSESLVYQANSEADDHKYSKAVSDAMLALDALSVPRMFDYSSLSACSIPQRRALDVVSRSISKLPASEQFGVRKMLLKFSVTPQNLVELTMDTRSILFRFEDSPNAGKEDYNKLESYISVAHSPSLNELRKTKEVPIERESDDNLIDLVNEYRLGYASALEMNEQLSKV